MLTNPYLDEAKVQQPPDYAVPYADNTFDIVFSNCVIEHITDARQFFGEVYRVLKPGGIFLAKTPNRHHYVPWLARLTPHWFHEFYNRVRGRETDDTFPTTYACNSRSDILRDGRLDRFPRGFLRTHRGPAGVLAAQFAALSERHGV